MTKLIIISLLLAVAGCQTVEPMTGAKRFALLRIVDPVHHVIVEIPRDRVVRPTVKRYQESGKISD